MSWSDECAAVLPCLNEEAAISRLVEEVRRLIPRVYVVDDGSTDRTATEADEAGAVLLRGHSKRGKGNALEHGFSRAYQDGYLWAICLDGDGQHDPQDIPKFIEEAERGKADLVVGNRMGASESMPCIRRVVNRWMSQRLSSLLKTDLPDSQCGFRLVNLEAWSKLGIQAEEFEVESEMLFRFIEAGHELSFVPVRTVYAEEKSKIRPFRDAIRWLKWYFRASRSRAITAIDPEMGQLSEAQGAEAS